MSDRKSARSKRAMSGATASTLSACRGFTLVELLIALTVSALLLTAVFLVFFRARGEAGRIGTMVDARQGARAVVQLIERDVRMSGSGWGRIPVNVSNNGTAGVLYAITPGGGTGANDSIQIVGAWSTTTSMAASMPSATSNLKVVSVAGFATNDLVVVTNGNSAHLFQVTGIDAANKLLLHANSSTWNVVPGSWAWPAGGYGSGTPVYKVEILSYRIDATNFQKPALTRRPLGSPPQVVAYDVNKFQVWYRLQDGTLTRTPVVTGSGVPLIDKVRPLIVTSLVDPSRPTFVDSVWSEVKPRTF